MTIDLLKEMPQITGEIGRVEADLPSASTLCKAFDRISMSVCRVLLRQSAQLHDPSKHGAIDATFYERSAASRHYCQRTSYRVQKSRLRNSSIQTLKPSLTFTAQRIGKGATPTSVSRSPVGTRAICGLLLPTRDTTRNRSANPFVTSGFARSSNIASLHPMITRTTPESTNSATISAL